MTTTKCLGGFLNLFINTNSQYLLTSKINDMPKQKIVFVFKKYKTM